MLLEICVNSLQSALAARQGGARRIELCQDLASGGITPSAGLIRYCVQHLEMETRVLIRPRSGNFTYSSQELEVIAADIKMCRDLGAAAVVIGFLNSEGDIDVPLTKEMVKLALPMEVTFHRAFDACRHPQEALEQLIDCGCHKLLTSGCAPTAMEGASLIRQLMQQAQGRIGIIAASGITPDNVRQVVEATGVNEVHGSCKRVGTCEDGGTELFPFTETVTDASQVAEMVRILNG